MKIFVTGATGVIGRRLVPILHEAGHDVTAVSRSLARRGELERAGAQVVSLDLFNASAVRRAIAGHEIVINLATHIPHSSTQMLLPWAWRENDRIRRVASRVLVDACAGTGVHRFIQESFAPIYPDRGGQWIAETTPIAPSSYNRTIADAEAATLSFSHAERAGVVLRFGAFYGPDATQLRDLASWIKRGWAPLPGAPEAYVSSVSHDDAATAVAAALAVPPGTYNVVDDEPVTHRAFVDSLADALGVRHPRLPPRWITPLLGSPGEMLARSLRISNRKLRATSTWLPAFPNVRQGWPSAVAGLRDSQNESHVTLHPTT